MNRSRARTSRTAIARYNAAVIQVAMRRSDPDLPAEAGSHTGGAGSRQRKRSHSRGGDASIRADRSREQDRQRRQHREDVARLLANRDRVEDERKRRPQEQPPLVVGEAPRVREHGSQRAQRQRDRYSDHGSIPPMTIGTIEPERARLVEPVGRKALEVVRDEEALEVRGAMCHPHAAYQGRPIAANTSGGNAEVADSERCGTSPRATRSAAARGRE